MSGTSTKLDFGDADFALMADSFYRIVSAMFDELLITVTDTTCEIKSGSNKTKLQTLPTKGFPEVIPPDSASWYTQSDLKAAFDKVAFTAGQNAMKPELMGVAAVGTYLYASDGFRISRQSLLESVTTPMMLPNQTVEHIRRLGQPDMLFSSGDSRIGALYRDTKTVYVSNVLAAKFPTRAADDWLGTVNQTNCFEFPEELLPAIGRVKLLAPAEDTDVVISHKDSQLTVSTQSEGQAATETIHWNCPQPFRFAVNPFLLEPMLERTRKVDISSLLQDTPSCLRLYDTGFDLALGLKHLRS